MANLFVKEKESAKTRERIKINNHVFVFNMS